MSLYKIGGNSIENTNPKMLFPTSIKTSKKLTSLNKQTRRIQCYLSPIIEHKVQDCADQMN